MTRPHTHYAWQLTIHFFPRAAQAGLQPIEATYAQFPVGETSGGGGEAYYRPHAFVFQNPPTRHDFLVACNGLVWAQHVWADSLFPLIRDHRNPWPMMDWMHKGAWSDIYDSEGRKVGRLDLDRMEVIENPAYSTLPVTVAERDAFINRRVHPGKRAQAREVVLQNENRIRERVMEMAAEHGHGPLIPDLMSGIEEVLVAADLARPAKSACKLKQLQEA